MNILSQILNISSKNLLIDWCLHQFKEKLHTFLDKLIFETNHNFIDIVIELQTISMILSKILLLNLSKLLIMYLNILKKEKKNII